MLRVLIIEVLLFALFGAVVFRLLFAFTGRTWLVWGIDLLLIALISVVTTGVIAPRLAQEFGGMELAGLTPRMLQVLRAAAWVCGSVFAWMILRWRARKGLQTPDELPPGDI
jgi:hypothetical protein